MNFIKKISIVAASLAFVACSSPESKLASNAEDIADILSAMTPENGKEIGQEFHFYMQDNLPDMAYNAGVIMQEVYRAEGDAEKQARLEKTLEQVLETLESNKEDWKALNKKLDGKGMFKSGRDAEEYFEDNFEKWGDVNMEQLQAQLLAFGMAVGAASGDLASELMMLNPDRLLRKLNRMF